MTKRARYWWKAERLTRIFDALAETVAEGYDEEEPLPALPVATAWRDPSIWGRDTRSLAPRGSYGDRVAKEIAAMPSSEDLFHRFPRRTCQRCGRAYRPEAPSARLCLICDTEAEADEVQAITALDDSAERDRRARGNDEDEP